MTYDLLIKNGRVIDGSGTPAFRGDVAVRSGKIAEIGKLRGSASRTIDAQGAVVSPGFVDTHCHYDAQVTWDPLCTFSCYHGVTSVLIGNCSLALAPVQRGGEERLSEFLSQVEAIPMDALRTVKMEWETIPQYLDHIDKRLGMNVGTLIGHTAVRYYVMKDDSQSRVATPAEVETMRNIVREGMLAGALGLSISKQKGHYDAHGVRIPAFWADEAEIFALGDVLAELGTGIIQSGGGRDIRLHDLMSRLSQATGRQVVYGSLVKSIRAPDQYKQHMAMVDETTKAGIRASLMCSPNFHVSRFTMRNAQLFRGVPSWHAILVAPNEEKLRAYADPEVRGKMHREVVEWSTEVAPGISNSLPRNWYDSVWLDKAVLPKNQPFEGKSLREFAQAQGKGIIDAFLDLAVEENLDTSFLRSSTDNSVDVMSDILNYPNAFLGLSDGGAHVQFQSGYGYSTRLLGYWVREKNIMSLEKAIRRLTFESASLCGIYDRGLLRPGLAADITIFDPDTVNPLPEEVVHDFPAGGWRRKELAQGIHYTIVNGQVLLEEGRHTGALPGRVLRNTLYREKLAS